DAEEVDAARGQRSEHAGPERRVQGLNLLTRIQPNDDLLAGPLAVATPHLRPSPVRDYGDNDDREPKAEEAPGNVFHASPTRLSGAQGAGWRPRRIACTSVPLYARQSGMSQSSRYHDR